MTLRLTYDLLPASLVRAIITEIGRRAGLDGEYWQTGVLIFESKTQSRALIEAEIAEPGWNGRITIRTQSGDARGLADTLLLHIRQVETQIGIRGTLEAPPDQEQVREAWQGKSREAAPPPLTFSRDPAAPPSAYLSYTHADKPIRDELDLLAQRYGVLLRYDERDMASDGLVRERITQFIDRLAKGDRVVVIMSPLYLIKPYCVRELVKTWIESRQRADEFCGRLRVLVRADAPIDESGRIALIKHWKGEIERIAADAPEAGYAPVSGEVLNELRQWLLNLDKILHLVANDPMPREIEAFAAKAFEDLTLGRGKCM